jgi:hypothetical protein
MISNKNIWTSKWSQIKKSLDYKVVDLVEYYNFNIKFIFIRHHLRNLWSFLAAYHCRFKPRTDSDSISVNSWLKSAVITQYHWWFLTKTNSDMNRLWRPKYQFRFVLSLLILAKNRQWWAITVGFFKSVSDEADSDVQFFSSVSSMPFTYSVAIFCTPNPKQTTPIA